MPEIQPRFWTPERLAWLYAILVAVEPMLMGYGKWRERVQLFEFELEFEFTCSNLGFTRLSWPSSPCPWVTVSAERRFRYLNLNLNPPVQI
jgi:hypothetical protein